MPNSDELSVKARNCCKTKHFAHFSLFINSFLRYLVKSVDLIQFLTFTTKIISDFSVIFVFSLPAKKMNLSLDFQIQNRKMKHAILSILLISVFVMSCKNNKDSESLNPNRKSFDFYLWKLNANYSEELGKILDAAQTKNIYLHYFDISLQYDQGISDSKPYPNYVVRSIDSNYMQYNIIPVIYIENEVFSHSFFDLDEKIPALVDQISQTYFGKRINKLQLDCDWTESTRTGYFNLIDALSSRYEISVTIRLHQIKYRHSTGIPPVEKGVLMLYNMGSLYDFDRNSIIDYGITEEYLGQAKAYPVKLDVALPLFSQAVIKNNDNEIRLVRKPDLTEFERNKHAFKKTGDNVFELISDTLYHGHYLSKGFIIKVEEPYFDDIKRSYDLFRNSKLNTGSTILYDLDEGLLEDENFKSLLSGL